MSTLLRLVKLVFRSSGDNILLVSDVVRQHFFQVQRLWLVVDKCQHDHTECILQLCVLVKLIEHHICIGIPAQFNVDPHALAVRFIRNSRNSVDFLVPYKISHLLNQTCFIYHIRNLSHNNPALAVRHGLNICHGTHPDLTLAGAVRFLNAASSEDLCSRREIRSLDDLQNLLHIRLSALIDAVVDHFNDRTDDLPQIVRRNICRHTDGDSIRSVYQKVRKTCRQYGRLLLCFIKVWYEVHGIFSDIRQHLH